LAHSKGGNQKSNNHMKITFEINQPADQFETGRVSLTATDPQQIIELCRRDSKLSKDPVAFSEALTKALNTGSRTHTDPDPHFLVSGSLELEFTEPYFQGIERIAGASIPEFYTAYIDLLPAFDGDRAYMYLTKAALECGHFSFELAQEDYHLKDELHKRFSKAQRHAKDAIEEILGVRPYHKEYKELGNGTFKKNPLYATGDKLPVGPCIAHERLWDLLLEWWTLNVASPLQKAAVTELIEGGPKKTKGQLLSYAGDLRWYTAYTLYLPDANGPVVYGSGAVAHVRVIKDLSEESLKGWTPGINITPTTTSI
jgi:hypothetical protein